MSYFTVSDLEAMFNDKHKRWKWGLFLLIAGIMVWRITIVGLSSHYAHEDRTVSAQSALLWYESNPHALFERGVALTESDPALAERLLRRALWHNPANGRYYMALASLWEQQGRETDAARLVDKATELSPMRGNVQLQAGLFWLHRQRLERALKHWGQALELRPAVRRDFYPSLLRFAENPQTRPAFETLLQEPPAWWDDFFRYATANAVSVDTLRALYGQRSDPLELERQVYMERLRREGRWQELYFTWLNGLTSEQLNALGNVYNGSFELPLSQQGFGWQTPSVRGVAVETGSTYGIHGSRALQVTFQGQRQRFRHLYQYLYLDPGQYQLRGRVRPDDLRTARGLQWVLYCVTDIQEPLVASELFLGTEQWKQLAPDWQGFTSEFTVPEECPAQLLRLELAGRIASDYQASGTIWFDSLAIRKLN